MRSSHHHSIRYDFVVLYPYYLYNMSLTAFLRFIIRYYFFLCVGVNESFPMLFSACIEVYMRWYEYMSLAKYIYIYINVYIYMCVCVCICKCIFMSCKYTTMCRWADQSLPHSPLMYLCQHTSPFIYWYVDMCCDGKLWPLSPRRPAWCHLHRFENFIVIPFKKRSRHCSIVEREEPTKCALRCFPLASAIAHGRHTALFAKEACGPHQELLTAIDLKERQQETPFCLRHCLGQREGSARSTSHARETRTRIWSTLP